VRVLHDLRRRRLLAAPDVAAVTVPLRRDHPGGTSFQLAYAIVGTEQAGSPLVVLPGGRGLASVLPYRGVRRALAGAGFRVLVPEHRGVGLSGLLPGGARLPRDAMRMDEAAADVLEVLDGCGIDKAFLAGSSYGGYLALTVALQAPDRFLGLILDSTAASARHHERELQRALFWRGDDPRTAEVARLVRLVAERGLAGEEELVGVVPAVFELAGPEVLVALLRRVAAGRRPLLWRRLASAVAAEVASGKPLVFEPDPALAIWFAEIDRTPPDGQPFDRALLMESERRRYADLPFRPFELAERLGELAFPAVVLAGDRDARVPQAAANELVDRLPDARLVRFPHAGHDLLRMRTRAVVRIISALARGGTAEAARIAEQVRHARPRAEQTLALLARLRPGPRSD